MSWEHVLFVLFVAVCTVKSSVCTVRLFALISSLSVPFFVKQVQHYEKEFPPGDNKSQKSKSQNDLCSIRIKIKEVLEVAKAVTEM